MRTTSLAALFEQLRNDWPVGACSLFHEIVDHSGVCGRCGWSVEDHEYMHDERLTDNG